MKYTISGIHFTGVEVLLDPINVWKNLRLLSSSSSHQARSVEQSWHDGAQT